MAVPTGFEPVLTESESVALPLGYGTITYILYHIIYLLTQKNIKKDENFIVIPEGQIFNYIHKKPWEFYNSTFTPLDFETFKDEQLINKLETNKTPYIIFFPRNTIDYGKISICYDYGVDFCTYVMDNYTRIAILEDNYKVLIFKRNEK